jgi:large subunit ribosomal protein L2
MALKQYNPTTPSQRGLVLVDKSSLWKGKPVKALTEGKRKTGAATTRPCDPRGIAGGYSRSNAMSTSSVASGTCRCVERLEYDPNRPPSSR